MYYTRLALRSLLHPDKFEIPIRAPRPPPKKIAYYLDANNRGYLSSAVQLMRLKQRLAQGVENPTHLLPVFVGGADPSTVITDIDLDASAERVVANVEANTSV